MPGGSAVARLADLVAGREQRHAQPAERPAARDSRARRRGRDPPARAAARRQARSLPSATSSPAWRRLAPFLIPGLQPHPPVLDDAVLLHHDRVGALGHRGAGEDADRLAALGGTAERVTRGGPAGNRQHGFPLRHQIGVGERHSRRPRCWRAAASSSRQRDRERECARRRRASGAVSVSTTAVTRSSIRAERRVDAQQRAAKGEAIIAQLRHRAQPGLAGRG